MRYRDTRGDDDLVGTTANDLFHVRFGYDRVTGGGGYDRLVADYGAQTSVSYAPDTILIREDGLMFGTLYGGDRSSVDFTDIDELHFTASGARDLMSVQINGDPTGQSIYVDAGGGEDVLTLTFVGTNPNSVIIGDDDVIHARSGVYANFERCFVYFGDGDDVAVGGPSGDQFAGRHGRDDLSGGGGDDFLYAGPGADRLSGGAGADLFYYFSAHDSRPDRPDRIVDFRHVEGDTISLGRIDADKSVPGNQYFTFIDQQAFTGPGGTGGEVRQQVNGDGTVTLQGDVNHDGVADFAIVVTTAQPLVEADLHL